MTTEMLTQKNAQSVLDAARKRRDAIEAEKLAAAEELRAAESALESQRAAVETAQQKIRDQVKAAEQAELDERRAKAAIPPDRVTLAVAEDVANQLLDGFAAYHNPVPGDFDDMRRIDAFWLAVDDCRDRLLTDEIDDDATLIVLATEGVIQACERWELARGGRNAATDRMDVESLGSCPADNRRVESLEKELRSVLAGEAPKRMESLGRLVSQGVDFKQVCKMIGLVQPTGAPAVEVLGAIIDNGDVAQDSFEFVRWFGTTSFAKAWQTRQADVPRRRSFHREHFMASAHGAVRPDRLPGRGVASRAHREEDERFRRAFQATTAVADEEEIIEGAQGYEGF